MEIPFQTIKILVALAFTLIVVATWIIWAIQKRNDALVKANAKLKHDLAGADRLNELLRGVLKEHPDFKEIDAASGTIMIQMPLEEKSKLHSQGLDRWIREADTQHLD